MQTETILLALLSQATDGQLASAFQELRGLNDSCADVDSRPGVLRRENFGSAYWERFPLNSVGEVRRWWADRSLDVASTPCSPGQDSTHAMVDAPQLEDSASSMGDYREGLLEESEDPTMFGSVRSTSVAPASKERCGAGSPSMKGQQKHAAEDPRRAFLETNQNLQVAASISRSQAAASDDYESAYLW